MGEQTLKVGNGIFYGVSNDTPQKDKKLTVCDGTAVLAVLKLDDAHPDVMVTLPDGTEEWRPGVVFDAVFQTELRTVTDGQNITMYWM